ncbi:hypothetical protein [Rhodohalobacter sp.]|uniref:hypothetical protein n=1 Tax=Rhodohalobacter sp. TaxID=1974210 RepID=UPI002ACDB2E1|nr:hypothetical protein [Rhodohalobacter sp.]MDZ7756180.1 hypothetical protein [Rhodohalobacter sp.]
MKRYLATACVLVAMIWSTNIYAQFEGQISMNLYSEDNGNTKVNKLNMFATSTRIMIQGDENVNFMQGMSTDGLLIRNDMKDFVILTGSNQALQVTKSEIEGLVEMMASWSGESENETPTAPEVKHEFSDRTEIMLGLETAEMIIRDKDNPEKHVSVWLTPDVDINWGMLGEGWKNMPEVSDRELNGVVQDIVFQGKNFPLKIEAVDGEERTTIMEVTDVNRSSVAKAMVEIPSGTTLMSFKDFMFQKMMEY